MVDIQKAAGDASEYLKVCFIYLFSLQLYVQVLS